MNTAEWPQAERPDWQTRRLRFVLETSPSDKGLALADDDTVSFVPMDAVGEHGGLRLDQRRPWDAVRGSYTYFQDNDVVVAKITPCFENGKGAIAESLTNGVAYGTTELHVLRSGAELDPRFLFYLTLSHPFRKLGEAEMYGAGGQKRVPERFIKELRPALPDVAEQQTIARFLDYRTTQLDALIEKKRQLLDKLAEKRSALITRAVTKGLDPDAPMKHSGVPWLGEIPAHWGLLRLRFCTKKIEQGWSPQCEARPSSDDEWGVLKVGAVNGEIFDPLENKALPTELEPKTEYELKLGDVLVSRANTKELLGSAAFITGPPSKLLVCDKLFRIKPSDELNSFFFVFSLRSDLSRFQYEREATGTSGSMQNIGQDTLKNLLLPTPPPDEQEKIRSWLESSKRQEDQLRMKVEKAINVLRKYRSALITAAVTGQIDVRDWQPPETSAT